MKTKSKLLLAILLVIALVQFSCDLPVIPGESGYERQRAECTAAGGEWRVEIVDGDLEQWCEYPPASGDPTKGGTEVAAPTTQGGNQANPTPDRGCDAYSLVSVQATLQNDGPGVYGTRDCDYTLTITNNSDQELILSLHYVIHVPADPAEPHWMHTYLMPGEVRVQGGDYYEFPPDDPTRAGDYRTWYTDRIAVTYPACYETDNLNEIPDAVIEPFAQAVQFYCSP